MSGSSLTQAQLATLTAFADSAIERAKALGADTAAVNAEIQEKVKRALENRTFDSIDWAKVELNSLRLTSKSQQTTPRPPKRVVKFSGDGRRVKFRVFERRAPAKAKTTNQLTTITWKNKPVVGLSTALQKDYELYTSVPDPAVVRTPAALAESFAIVLSQSAHCEDEEARFGYAVWARDQLRSIRQDLVVQGIEDDLSCKVLETIAEFAIGEWDMNEFASCLPDLKKLYGAGVEGNRLRFLCYKLLYLIHTRAWDELNLLTARLSSDNLRDPLVALAIKLREAVYHDNLGAALSMQAEFTAAEDKEAQELVELVLVRVKLRMMLRMARVYESLPFAFIQLELRMQTGESEEEKQAAEETTLHFLVEGCGVECDVDEGGERFVDCQRAKEALECKLAEYDANAQ